VLEEGGYFQHLSNLQWKPDQHYYKMSGTFVQPNVLQTNKQHLHRWVPAEPVCQVADARLCTVPRSAPVVCRQARRGPAIPRQGVDRESHTLLQEPHSRRG